MQSKPKANSVITSRIPDDVQMVEVQVRIPASMIFEVRNADGTIFADHALDLTKIHADNLGRAVVHGMNQRVPDAAAIGVQDKDGNIIPKAERTRIKSEKINEVCVHYESGTAEWSRKGSGSGFGASSVAVEAFARAENCTYESAKERIERRAKAAGRTYQKQLQVVREVYPDEVEAIERERASTRKPIVDADALAAELTAMKESAE